MIKHFKFIQLGFKAQSDFFTWTLLAWLVWCLILFLLPEFRSGVAEIGFKGVLLLTMVPLGLPIVVVWACWELGKDTLNRR